jgi:hypothetical protein
MKGMKPNSQQPKEEDKENDANILKVPNEIFEDFHEINEENEDLFEFLAYSIIINFLEKKCIDLKNWDTAIEFPDVIASNGRLKLHEVADYFGLAHHSAGKKGKNRRTLVYPRTLFKDKQETEKSRLEKERNKIREKYTCVDSFHGEPTSNPTNFKEKVLRELWEEKYAKVKSTNPVSILIPQNIGQAPDPA